MLQSGSIKVPSIFASSFKDKVENMILNLSEQPKAIFNSLILVDSLEQRKRIRNLAKTYYQRFEGYEGSIPQKINLLEEDQFLQTSFY